MSKKFYKTVIPDKLICNSILRKIRIIDPEYYIENFIIYFKNKKIDKIVISKGKHPNCDPKTRIFCIPEFFNNFELDDKSLDIIINMFKIFNFDSAFYQPWKSFEYDDQEAEV